MREYRGRARAARRAPRADRRRHRRDHEGDPRPWPRPLTPIGGRRSQSSASRGRSSAPTCPRRPARSPAPSPGTSPGARGRCPTQSDREERLHRLIEADVRERFLPHGECWTIGGASTTLWIPPVRPGPATEVFAQAPRRGRVRGLRRPRRRDARRRRADRLAAPGRASTGTSTRSRPSRSSSAGGSPGRLLEPRPRDPRRRRRPLRPRHPHAPADRLLRAPRVRGDGRGPAQRRPARRRDGPARPGGLIRPRPKLLATPRAQLPRGPRRDRGRCEPESSCHPRTRRCRRAATRPPHRSRGRRARTWPIASTVSPRSRISVNSAGSSAKASSRSRSQSRTPA